MWPRGSRDKILATEREYYRLLCSFSGKKVSDHLLELTGNINIKAGALLTHVSVMIIASTAIAYLNPVTLWFIEGGLKVEIVMYLGICVLILSSVGITDRNTFRNCNVPLSEKELVEAEDSNKAESHMMMVVYKRRFRYTLALNATLVFTILLVIGVSLEYIVEIFAPNNVLKK